MHHNAEKHMLEVFVSFNKLLECVKDMGIARCIHVIGFCRLKLLKSAFLQTIYHWCA